jgi:hypothetical protein
MKSVGEVMAIGRSFEEVLQKAIRMCDNGKYGLVSNLHESNESDANSFTSDSSPIIKDWVNNLAQEKAYL